MDKDYYKILDLPYTASEQEIKSSYRQLVKKYHPDKNEGDRQAEDQFKEVQEAYEVLSQPDSRAAYNQQRWYKKNSHKQQSDQRVTSYLIFHKCRDLNRYIFTLDKHHINLQALSNYVMQVLSSSTLKILREENDKATNQLIIKELLKSIYPIPLKATQNIMQALNTLADDDLQAIKVIDSYVKEKKFSDCWSKYTPLLALIIAILICVFIYIISKNNQ